MSDGPQDAPRPQDARREDARPTLAAFLIERLAEDEAIALGWPSGAELIARRWSPERILADVDAKRRIVANLADLMDLTRGSTNAVASARAVVVRRVLADLASVYSDHPDFRPEWRA